MLRTPVENLVDTDEEPVFAINLDNQVDGELAFGGVNGAHCTEILVYINSESTSYWQYNLTASNSMRQLWRQNSSSP